jgi:crossover junction endodeoxyribonuclease RuvC
VNFIGIDPGLQGGIATIHKGGEITTLAMPTIKIGKKRMLDNALLAGTFSLPNILDIKSYAILEQQQAMPKQGVTSMFSIGYGFGALKQCLVDFNIPHEVVRAQTWQKEFDISGRKGNTKAQALQICQNLFPNLNLLATERSKKPHEGIVDAMLIAEFARRKHEGAIKK